MGRPREYSKDLRDEAVRLVRTHRPEYESEWAAMTSVAAKFGVHPESVRKWVRQAEADDGVSAGVTSDERKRLKELEREVHELRRANEILKAASAFFAAELDPRLKP